MQSASIHVKMMPLPQLLDGFGRGRLDVLQKALNLHCRAFRNEFMRYLSGGVTLRAEEHVTKMAVLFETLMNLLKKSDKPPAFRLSVLNQTVDHIKDLINELDGIKLAANSVSIQQKNAVLELLHFHLNHLQSLKEEISITSEPIPTRSNIVPEAHVTLASRVLVSNLSTKTDEEIVRHALLSVDAVACARELLLSRGEKNVSQVTEFIQSVADGYINELLQKRQIEVAKDVLRNTDRDIWPFLKNVCLSTMDSIIRDFLALELSTVNILDPVEIDTWKFLILIEGIIKNTDLKICKSEETLRIDKVSDGGKQLELSIAELLTLSSPVSTRNLLLTELYFKTSNGTLEPMLIKDVCWQFLLTNNQIDILIKWIYATSSKLSEFQQSDRLANFLSSWVLTQDMIDHIFESKCSPVTKECVLDCLSKFGLYSTNESCSVNKRFLRAIHTSQICDVFDENVTNLFVEFCVQCDMPDLLVSCDMKTDIQTTAWLELYHECMNLKDDPHLKQAISKCIDYCAKYIKVTKSNNLWFCLAEVILSDHTLIDTLDETDGIAGLSKDDLHFLKETLSNHSKFQYLLANKSTEVNPSDICLQSLLKKKFHSNSNHPILKHQSLCSMFKDEFDGSGIDFSHEPTILLYGHSETLDFKYFLKQGRPCHAAMLVLAEVIRNFGKPSHKLLKRPILSAHELAFLNNTDQMITASCIAFLEMLGATSLSLRTHLSTIKQISSFSNDQGKNRISELPFHQFLAKETVSGPQEVFEYLQGCLPMDFHAQGLAVQFANLHKLPLPTRFLVHSAQKDDWMNFFLFCEIYSYPLDMVKTIAKHFQSVALRDHLQSFLCKSSSKTSPDSSRHRTAQRVSTSEVPCLKDLEYTPLSASSKSNEASMALSANVVLSQVEESIFGVLLMCHNCNDPAEALLHMCIEMPCPILAVLAEFYQANAETQLVAWLVSWLPQEERVTFECYQKKVPWPPEIVESVILRSLEISCSHLLKGFKIFIPEHPLVLVLEVIEGLSTGDQVENDMGLIFLKDLNLNSKNDSPNRNNAWCLDSASVVLQVAIKMLVKSLECIRSVNEKRKLLLYLCKANILEEDSLRLLTLLDILAPLDVQIDISNYFKDSAGEINKCVEKLLELEMFKEAAACTGKTFVIEEQTLKFERFLKSNFQDFREFCNECDSSFGESLVDPSAAFNFFQKCSLHLKKNSDKWRALRSAKMWLQHSIANSHSVGASIEIEETEMAMWKCCLIDRQKTIFHVLAEELKHSPSRALCSEYLSCNFKFSEKFHECSMVCEEQLCPSDLINCLLDIGDIVSAHHVQKFFQSNHQDLEILYSCINLAQEKFRIQEIPSNWALFFALDFRYTSSLPAPGNGNEAGQTSSSENFDHSEGSSVDSIKVLSTIQALCKQLKHGKEIGKQLIACYRLAMNLRLTYNEVIAVTEPLKLLRTAISQSYSGDYSFVSDIMMAFRLSPSERARFLSREIIAAISKGPAHGNIKVILLWGHDLEQHFQHLLELIPDPSLLGNELMTMMSKLAISDKKTPKGVLDTAVELLVRAHDCYAASCHMEGISQVLRTVSNFAPVLKARSEWSLMVRLLTGIQRYTEMSYIFNMLKDDDHFEFLLRKDSVKPLGFKLALLDWLRKKCPNDTALLKMTAAHFQMHQQEAALWQSEGSDRLKNILDNKLQNNQKTKLGLQTAMQDFSHASECYLQADMLNHAMTCAHQAELVALQIYLLSSSSDGSILTVILLDPKSVSKLVVSTLSFDQALIVSKAYNHRTDWAAALFYHCVCPGLSSEEYYKAWSSCMELTPSIIQNIAYRLQRTTAVSREMTSKMEWLLGHVKDMDVRYKIASELGLKNMVESLLQAPEVAYLKDTVWQSGFKR